MARNEQLIRQHKILEILEASRYGKTLAELRDMVVNELGLSSLHTRSIRRDLEALQAAGFHIDDSETQRGRVWKLGSRSRSVCRISATATELIALSMGRELLVPLAGTTFWQGIESFWNKVQEELPDSVWAHYQKYRRILHVMGTTSKSYANKQGILKTINQAILQHRVLEVTYQSLSSGDTQRRLEPYGVVFYQSSLYIVAAAEEVEDPQQRVRHWKLDRFVQAQLTDDYFRLQADFDLEQHVGRSVGIYSGRTIKRVKIWVSSVAARWVQEDPWHPDQRVKAREDGSLELIVPTAHPMEVIPRVLALGPEAELLEPASCRRAIVELVRGMHQRYAD